MDKEGSGTGELSKESSTPAETVSVDQPEKNTEVEDIEIKNVHDCIQPIFILSVFRTVHKFYELERTLYSLVRKIQKERTHSSEDCVPELKLIIVDADRKGWGIEITFIILCLIITVRWVVHVIYKILGRNLGVVLTSQYIKLLHIPSILRGVNISVLSS